MFKHMPNFWKCLKNVSFKGISNVVKITHMFGGCHSLKHIDFGKDFARKDIDDDHMFHENGSLKTIQIARYDSDFANELMLYLDGTWNFEPRTGLLKRE